MKSGLANRDRWQDAFPLGEAQRAAKFLRDTWEDLIASKPRGFHRKLRENQLTEKLYLYLARLSQGRGRLTGFWINENTDGELDDPDSDNPKVVKRIRKDVTYASNVGARLELIFEFKKITSKSESWREYRGEDGMRRFVDGTYAKGLPFAFMVGLLMDDEHETCVDGLKQSLQSERSRDDLHMVAFKGSEYLFEPSILFPEVAHFDTEHNRPRDRAPSHGTIVLSHMFVSMPTDK